MHGKIAKEAGAMAHVRAMLSRVIKPPLGPNLCAERQKVETFFQRIKHFRRIALCCEKTIPSFMGFIGFMGVMGFIFRVLALDWIL
jgi:transposase